MKLSPARPWLALAAAGLSVALTAGPALADVMVVPDGDDDAFSLVNGTVEVGDYDIDLRSVRIDHGASTLNVVSTFSYTNEDSWTAIQLAIDTNLDGYPDYGALWSKADGVSGVLTTDADNNPTGVTCLTLQTSEYLGVNGTVTIGMPRSCIGNPAQVAVRVTAIWDGQNTAGDPLTFLDTAPDLVPSGQIIFSPPVAAATSVTVPSTQAPVHLTSTAVATKLSTKSQKFGGNPVKLTLRITGAGAPAGTVSIIDGRKTLRTFAVRANRAVTYRLPRRLKPGVHRLTVRFTPSDGTKFAASARIVKIRVRR